MEFSLVCFWGFYRQCGMLDYMVLFPLCGLKNFKRTFYVFFRFGEWMNLIRVMPEWYSCIVIRARFTFWVLISQVRCRGFVSEKWISKETPRGDGKTPSWKLVGQEDAEDQPNTRSRFCLPCNSHVFSFQQDTKWAGIEAGSLVPGRCGLSHGGLSALILLLLVPLAARVQSAEKVLGPGEKRGNIPRDQLPFLSPSGRTCIYIICSL